MTAPFTLPLDVEVWADREAEIEQLFTELHDLIHGRKSPNRQRDVELVRESQHVLDRMLPPLLEAIR